MHYLKYRYWLHGIPPSPIKLQIPGWAGEKTYDHAQPWHCKPFVDASTHGLELIYPFDVEATVTTKNDKLEWTGDFTKIASEAKHEWERPFANFAPHHFGFTSSLDIQVEKDYSLMILPHPRFYTDRTGTVPCAVAGMLETHWWPRIFFVVFKSPFEGQTYVFRKGEAYAQLIVMPTQAGYDLVPMTEIEKKDRAMKEEMLRQNFRSIATKTWKTKENDTFDNKYKVLARDPEKLEIKLEEKFMKEKNAHLKFPRKVIF